MQAGKGFADLPLWLDFPGKLRVPALPGLLGSGHADERLVGAPLRVSLWADSTGPALGFPVFVVLHSLREELIFHPETSSILPLHWYHTNTTNYS